MARRDYFYDPKAPKPNSIRPAAGVAPFDSIGNILLLRRKDNDKWTMPGGTLDFGESLTDCATREVREETGLNFRITGLIGTYTDPHILIGYSNGEVRQEFTFVYAAEIESGELKIDDESKEATWAPLAYRLKEFRVVEFGTASLCQETGYAAVLTGCQQETLRVFNSKMWVKLTRKRRYDGYGKSSQIDLTDLGC